MKKLCKKLLLMMMCLALVQVPALGLQQSVQAAAKNGLVKSGGKIYFYQDGKKIKNQWKTVKNQKYYFNAKGVAYAAPKAFDYDYPGGMKQNIIVKKIGGVQYGFTVEGYRVKTGVYATDKGKVYIFANKKVDVKKTNQFSTAVKKKTITSSNIKKYLGKVKKTEISDSCKNGGGKDIILTFAHVQAVFYQSPAGQEEFMGVNAR